MSKARVAAVFAAAFSLAGGSAAAKSVTTEPAESTGQSTRPSVHVVKEGDSLWTIARTYGCMPEDLKRVNRLTSNLIHPGTKLQVPRHCGDPADDRDDAPGEPAPTPEPKQRAVDAAASGAAQAHQVVSGDTLWKIAKAYDTSVEDIQLRNGLSSTDIRPGQKLEIMPGSGASGRAIVGQSVGRAWSGRLVSPSRLTRGAGYYIRRPERTYGANHAVYAVKRALAVVHRRYPKAHVIAVGDLSVKKGGRISGHHSHQSGRDVDIGFVFKKKPKSYPKEFVVATDGNLDKAATWTLVSTFAGMADTDNGVERIFLGYDTQRLLYKWAKKHGVSSKTLGRVFQYPNGRESPTGIVRHEPAHDDHLHVRFKCPKGDKRCQ